MGKSLHYLLTIVASAVTVALLFSIPVIASTASGVIFTSKDSSLRSGGADTGGVVTSPEWSPLNSVVETEWVSVGSIDDLQLDIAFDYTDGSATQMEMQCWYSQENTGSIGDLDVYEIHQPDLGGTALAPEATTGQVTFITDVASADKSWGWTVKNIQGKFAKCRFTATSGSANDLLRVYAVGVTP